MEPTQPTTHSPAPAPQPAQPARPAPAPQPAQPARSIPARIAALLRTLRVLINHGRYLAEILPKRAGNPDFHPLTACFGTLQLNVILAILQRGMMRAAALERMLLERANTGRDIACTGPGKRRCAAPAEPADPAVPARNRRRPGAPPSRPRQSDDPRVFMPTMEEMEAQVRRRPIGRSMAEICLDLGVIPRFCDGPFWNQVLDAIRAYGGRIETLMSQRSDRQIAFIQELDRIPGSDWGWDNLARDGYRRVLGFFIGATPDPADPRDPAPAPGAPATAMATGPP